MNKYIDLDLPSGTLWMEDILEEGEKYRFTLTEIKEKNDIILPTKKQVKELFENCKWSLHKMVSLDIHSYKVTGKNGNFIHFPLPWNLGTYLHKIGASDYGPYLLDGGIYETFEDEINKTLNFTELNVLSIDSGTGYFLGYGRKDGNFLIKGVKNGKPFLKIDKPLFVYTKEGRYTDEILKIYGKDKI